MKENIEINWKRFIGFSLLCSLISYLLITFLLFLWYRILSWDYFSITLILLVPILFFSFTILFITMSKIDDEKIEKKINNVIEIFIIIMVGVVVVLSLSLVSDGINNLLFKENIQVEISNSSISYNGEIASTVVYVNVTNNFDNSLPNFEIDVMFDSFVNIDKNVHVNRLLPLDSLNVNLTPLNETKNNMIITVDKIDGLKHMTSLNFTISWNINEGLPNLPCLDNNVWLNDKPVLNVKII